MTGDEGLLYQVVDADGEVVSDTHRGEAEAHEALAEGEGTTIEVMACEVCAAPASRYLPGDADRAGVVLCAKCQPA